MTYPTIRCANPTCEQCISMPQAMRVGTRLYCSFYCAHGVVEGGLQHAKGKLSGARTRAAG